MGIGLAEVIGGLQRAAARRAAPLPLAALSALAALSMLAACATQAPRTTAPAAAAAPVVATPAAPSPPSAAPGTCQRPASAGAGYGSFDAAALAGLVGPPPAAGSEGQQRDLDGVLAAQRAARGTPRRAQAIADATASCARFADGLGGDVPAAVLPFLDRVAWQAAGATGAAKRHFGRARPYVGHPQVERLADIAADDAARDYSAYPSGHAAFGAACAILLAGMAPERADMLFERARGYAESREIVGAHYPRDVEAGRLAGALAMAAIRQDPCFREDEAPVRRALRAALGLPAAAGGR